MMGDWLAVGYNARNLNYCKANRHLAQLSKATNEAISQLSFRIVLGMSLSKYFTLKVSTSFNTMNYEQW